MKLILYIKNLKQETSNQNKCLVSFNIYAYLAFKLMTKTQINNIINVRSEFQLSLGFKKNLIVADCTDIHN